MRRNRGSPNYRPGPQGVNAHRKKAIVPAAPAMTSTNARAASLLPKQRRRPTSLTCPFQRFLMSDSQAKARDGA
ncbi:hypothetical protein B7486_19320 [cyanobacterium TDX16]|nr:hypothetical protein B7486_19320 [cyanobacterium TDX16]